MDPFTWRNLAIVLFLLWLAILALFHVFPSLDVNLQHLFFKPSACDLSSVANQVCGEFPYADKTLYVVLRRLFYYLPFAAAFFLLWRLVLALQHHGATYDRAFVHRMLILLATLALGPVLFVNVLLKEFSGRPRPYQTELFGGDSPFVAAGDFSGLCRANCSFVSGEAAGGSWLLCFILLLPPPIRNAVLPAILSLSLVSAAMRVAFGRHFLSDVMLGWLSTLVIFTVLCAAYGWPWSRTASKP